MRLRNYLIQLPYVPKIQLLTSALIFSGEEAAVHVLRGDPGCMRMEVFLKSFTALRGYDELNILRGNPDYLVLDMF